MVFQAGRIRHAKTSFLFTFPPRHATLISSRRVEGVQATRAGKTLDLCLHPAPISLSRHHMIPYRSTPIGSTKCPLVPYRELSRPSRFGTRPSPHPYIFIVSTAPAVSIEPNSHPQLPCFLGLITFLKLKSRILFIFRKNRRGDPLQRTNRPENAEERNGNREAVRPLRKICGKFLRTKFELLAYNRLDFPGWVADHI
jgi:hypothetical protein